MTSRLIQYMALLTQATPTAQADAPVGPAEDPGLWSRLSDWIAARWEAFTAWLHGVLDPVVDAVKPYTLDPVDRVMERIPLSIAQAAIIGLFVLAAVVCCCLRRKYVYLGAPDERRWRDLRIWSVLLVIPYILVYIVFGL